MEVGERGDSCAPGFVWKQHPLSLRGAEKVTLSCLEFTWRYTKSLSQQYVTIVREIYIVIHMVIEIYVYLDLNLHIYC